MTIRVCCFKKPQFTVQNCSSFINVVVVCFQIPEKKPLVRREAPEEVRAKVRRGSQKRQSNPAKILSEFQSPGDEMI